MNRSVKSLTDYEDDDSGCTAGPVLEHFVEIELAGRDPGERYPQIAAHLRHCAACSTDHDGLLELAREFGDAEPPPK